MNCFLTNLTKKIGINNLNLKNDDWCIKISINITSNLLRLFSLSSNPLLNSFLNFQWLPSNIKVHYYSSYKPTWCHFIDFLKSRVSSCKCKGVVSSCSWQKVSLTKFCPPIATPERAVLALIFLGKKFDEIYVTKVLREGSRGWEEGGWGWGVAVPCAKL